MYLQLIVAGIMVGTWIYHRYIEDHPATPRATDVVLPRVDEGTAIPMVYGQCRIRAPILVWSGNYLVPGQKYDPAVGLTANHFSIDALFILGVPFYGGGSDLTRAWSGDTSLTMDIGPVKTINAGLEETTVPPTAAIFQRFRGGPGKQIVDTSQHPADESRFLLLSIDGVFFGGKTQDVMLDIHTGSFGSDNHEDGVSTGGAGNSLRQAMIFSNEDLTLAPGMRSQIALYTHIAIGLTAAMPAFSFEVRSLSTGSASDLGQSLVHDADPAAVIIDLLTSPWAKLALPIAKIDMPSFVGASFTLFGEGHGYSRVIDQGADASEIINDVLKQTDGLIYEEPTTGRLVYRLVRKDYVVSQLDDINPDNASPSGSGWYSVQGWSETMNQVRVKFLDREDNYADSIAIGQNMANVIGQGGKLRSLDITYVGCCDRTLAATLASRELGVASRPITKATVIVNRSFYAKRPGDVVTLTWPELGIDHMIMRIVKIDLGQLHAGQIKIDMIRDIFDVKIGAFAVPTP